MTLIPNMPNPEPPPHPYDMPARDENPYVPPSPGIVEMGVDNIRCSKGD